MSLLIVLTCLQMHQVDINKINIPKKEFLKYLVNICSNISQKLHKINTFFLKEFLPMQSVHMPFKDF